MPTQDAAQGKYYGKGFRYAYYNRWGRCIRMVQARLRMRAPRMTEEDDHLMPPPLSNPVGQNPDADPRHNCLEPTNDETSEATC